MYLDFHNIPKPKSIIIICSFLNIANNLSACKVDLHKNRQREKSLLCKQLCCFDLNRTSQSSYFNVPSLLTLSAEDKNLHFFFFL